MSTKPLKAPAPLSRIQKLLALKEDSKESAWRRAHTRTEISRCPVEFRVGRASSKFDSAFVLNIGVGGAFLETDHDIRENGSFNLTFRLERAANDPLYFSVEAQVAHREEKGVGIEFLEIPPHKHEELRNIMREIVRLERLVAARESVEAQSSQAKTPRPDVPKQKSYLPKMQFALNLMVFGLLLGLVVASFQFLEGSRKPYRLEVKYNFPNNPVIESDNGIHTVRFHVNDVTALLMYPNKNDALIQLKSGTTYVISYEMLDQIPGLDLQISELRGFVEAQGRAS